MSWNVHDYPEPSVAYQRRREPRTCPDCDGEYTADGAFFADGEWICARCYETYLREYYTLQDIAAFIGTRHKYEI